MIKLALAIGFLAVFGFVAYALVANLNNHFKKENDKINKPKNKTENEQENN